MSTSKSSPLLLIKLMPPRLPEAVVPRERLLTRLDLGLERKVTLVSASTGFGKTTLVRTWIERREIHAAWLTLDEHDNDPVRFWTYVCSALRTLDSGLGKVTLSMLAGPQPPPPATLLTPLLNDLPRLDAPSVLVLEDYHVVHAPEIHEGVDFLIQHLSEPLHIVFITRTDPDLSLGILRARGDLVEVHASDLRFDEQETKSFLQATAQVELSPSAVRSLWQKVEGWPAGLRLGALALQERGNLADAEKWIESFSGSDRYVSEYLIQEVFASQPPEIQTFLMKTSFFRRLSGSLCDAVLGGDRSAALL